MAHTPASASTSGSASPHSNYSYDVFLSHRGPEVKKNFASHLYHRLRSYGFRVFLDQPELQRGEEIEPQINGAIATASVKLAIFSPGYAESRWCLDELVLMLKTGGTIIPVFYNVKPCALRWTEKREYNDGVYDQDGAILLQMGRDKVYAQALLDHEKKGRYDQKRLADWRKALYDVSHISGFELEAFNGDEGELVDEIGRQVQKKVPKAALHAATYPTGLDEKLQELERTVLLEQQQQRGGPDLVGIVGLGGLGKTTLAKSFFNTKRSDYQHSCFLPDVRDAAARRLPPSLQCKLYKALTGSDQLIDNVDEGITTLKDRLSCGQALIILDDVDDVEQLGALFLPVKESLPVGSLILLTSRNKDVLRKCAGIEELSIYKMTGLDLEHSKELFCSHAFHWPDPAVRYEKLVRECLNACNGLPLSLKVIGALLYSESLGYWKDQLDKLSRTLPTEIQRRLKISYDSLDKEEKEIFLDTACFFIGINRDTAIRVWDGSGWKGSLGLRTLESKCLVTFDEENCIRMHDHLRDLGRHLAEEELPRCPRRLWRPDSLFRKVSTESTIGVRGISLVQQRLGQSFRSPSEFSNRVVDTSGLQLLRAPADWLGNLSNLMRQTGLLWLLCEIGRFSLPPWIQRSHSNSSLSSCIPIKSLRVLELLDNCGLSIGILWNTKSEAPLQLREMIIAIGLLRLPTSIGHLKYLEKIELRNFKGTLPEEFFHLRSLKHLRLRAGMKSLPDSVGNLTNLRHMDLSGCDELQTLSPSLGNLTKLQHIDLSRCRKLQTLPPSFMNLIRVKHLDLSHCSVLTLSCGTLGNITNQQSLEKLVEDGTALKEFPSAIGDLSNLEILYLSSHSLETLPHSLGKLTNLKELKLGSKKLKYLPDSVCELKQLTLLSITGSPIREVPFASVEGGRRLLYSSIDKCMIGLRELDLSRTRITEISFGEGVCPVLERLHLNHCFDLVEVGALPTTLTYLTLQSCCALKKITGLHGLAKLKQLNMQGCTKIEELPGLETLISLKRFWTTDCENIKRIEVLAEAANSESEVLKKVIGVMVKLRG